MALRLRDGLRLVSSPRLILASTNQPRDLHQLLLGRQSRFFRYAMAPFIAAFTVAAMEHPMCLAVWQPPLRWAVADFCSSAPALMPLVDVVHVPELELRISQCAAPCVPPMQRLLHAVARPARCPSRFAPKLISKLNLCMHSGSPPPFLGYSREPVDTESRSYLARNTDI